MAVQPKIIKETTVNVELSQREAETLIALRQSKFFEARNCEVTINLDNGGHIGDIWLRNLGYRRGDTYQIIKRK